MQERPRFIGVDVNALALLDGGADDAESSPVTASGQSARIAVGQHAAFFGQQGSAVSAHGFARGDVFLVHCVGFGEKFSLYFCHCGSVGEQGGEDLLHAIDGPKKVDGGGAGRGQAIADARKLRHKFLGCRRLRLLCAERNAVGGGDSDGGGTAYHHGHDDVGDLFVVGGGHVALFERKLGLIDEANAFRRPCEGRNHAFLV